MLDRDVALGMLDCSPKETLASGPPKETRASAGAAQGNASDSVRALLKAAAQPQGFGAAQCSCLTPTSKKRRRTRTSCSLSQPLHQELQNVLVPALASSFNWYKRQFAKEALADGEVNSFLWKGSHAGCFPDLS